MSRVESETMYRVLNSDLKTVLLVKVDEQGYASIEDYGDATKADEFVRLLRGLANRIEQVHSLDATLVLAKYQKGGESTNAVLPAPGNACPNHVPVI